MNQTFAARHFEPFIRLPDAPIEQAVASLCKRVEALAPGATTGVCIASADRAMLWRAIFPHAPESFQGCIKHIPMGAPYFGSCTAAMDGNTIVTTHDMAAETRFDPQFVSVCLSHGIRSLQSRPVYGRDGTPIGTFVMSFPEPRQPGEFDAALMEFAADAVGAMLQTELDEKRTA